MKKTWISLSMLALLTVAGCSEQTNGNASPTPAPQTTTTTAVADSETIFLQKADLNGDGKLETVSLLGMNQDPNKTGSYQKEVLRIEAENNKQDLEIKPVSLTYFKDVSVADLTGDGKKEIVYRTYQEGTDKADKGKAQVIVFMPEKDGTYHESTIQAGRDPEFHLRMQNNLTYELLDPQINTAWTLKINDEDKIKQTGNPNMSGKKIQLEQPYNWSWQDIDNDGKQELVSKRVAWINTQSNMLFTVQTTFAWDGKNWAAKGYTIQPESGVQILE